MPNIRCCRRVGLGASLVVAVLLQVTCSNNPPPVEPESVSASTPAPSIPAAVPPAPPPPIEPPAMPSDLLPEDEFSARSLEDLNRESPLEPAYFGLDSSGLDEQAQRAVEANAELLRQYPSWAVTIEGHCDERGTAEYNLALGERRALVTQQYLVELGLDPTRVNVVSYGKEFPFDPGHDDVAWAANRRAHFVITAK